MATESSLMDDDLEPEYRLDYRKAKRNRFAEPIVDGGVVVMLDPDVAEVFTSAKTVNAVLRALIQNMPTATTTAL